MVSTRALETAYLYKFWTFLALQGWGAFPPGCFGPGRAGFGIGGDARTGNIGTGFGTGTGGPGTGSCRNRIEPKRTVGVLSSKRANGHTPFARYAAVTLSDFIHSIWVGLHAACRFCTVRHADATAVIIA